MVPDEKPLNTTTTFDFFGVTFQILGPMPITGESLKEGLSTFAFGWFSGMPLLKSEPGTANGHGLKDIWVVRLKFQSEKQQRVKIRD